MSERTIALGLQHRLLAVVLTVSVAAFLIVNQKTHEIRYSDLERLIAASQRDPESGEWTLEKAPLYHIVD